RGSSAGVDHLSLAANSSRRTKTRLLSGHDAEQRDDNLWVEDCTAEGDEAVCRLLLGKRRAEGGASLQCAVVDFVCCEDASAERDGSSLPFGRLALSIPQIGRAHV